jgi:hypothetical protein
VVRRPAEVPGAARRAGTQTSFALVQRLRLGLEGEAAGLEQDDADGSAGELARDAIPAAPAPTMQRSASITGWETCRFSEHAIPGERVRREDRLPPS